MWKINIVFKSLLKESQYAASNWYGCLFQQA